MDWVGKSASVCYCCVWKEGGVVYKYSIGNHEIDNMAALCLEIIPPYHRFYLETIAPYTFAFLMDDGFVYFAILRHSHGNSQLLSFLQNLRDEFTRIGRKGEFLPVVSGLVASLEGVRAWPAMSNANGDGGAGSSTKAPLLARPSKHDKKKKKTKMTDDGVGVRDIETAEHRRSTDSEGHGHGTTTKSSSQNVRDKWCRQVRIVLAIDAAVCILLFVIWLVICRGIECIR